MDMVPGILIIARVPGISINDQDTWYLIHAGDHDSGPVLGVGGVGRDDRIHPAEADSVARAGEPGGNQRASARSPTTPIPVVVGVGSTCAALAL